MTPKHIIIQFLEINIEGNKTKPKLRSLDKKTKSYTKGTN